MPWEGIYFFHQDGRFPVKDGTTITTAAMINAANNKNRLRIFLGNIYLSTTCSA